MPPASAITIEPWYRGASSNCATPTTPRNRSSIAISCSTRRWASGPNGSLRITARPGNNSRTTRVRSVSWTISVKRADPGPAALVVF